MNRKCEQFQSRIPDYIDGSLPVSKKNDMESHLSGCASCRNELIRQEKWLAGSFVKQEDAELAPEDQERLQERIMAAIRSNEQSHRAAAYINEYKNRADIQDAAQTEASDSINLEMINSRNNRKDRSFWRSLPVLAGYAAVLVLVSVTVLLVMDLNSPSNREGLPDQGERVMINEEAMLTETADEDMMLDAYSDDSATMPMITTEAMAAEGVEETNAIRNTEPPSVDTGLPGTDNSLNEKWKSFSGRLGELSLDPEMFSESEAFEAQGVFYSSKALRILTTQIQGKTSAETEQAPNQSEDVGSETSIETSSQKPTNVSQTTVGKVLILTAWNSWDIVDAADNLKYQLQEKESEYDIIILDDSTGIAKIEAMIGSEEAKAWQDQIKTQKLENLVWLALIAK